MATAIVVAIVVLGLVLLLMLRSRTPKLPDSATPPPEQTQTKTEPVAERAGAPKAPAAAAPAAPVKSPAAAAQEAAVAVHAAPTPVATPGPASDDEQEPLVASVSAPPDPRELDVAALRQGLASTRGGFIARLAKLFGKKQAVDKALLDEIEEVLITADLGVRTTERILAELRQRMERGELDGEQAVWDCIRAQALAILDAQPEPLRLSQKPAVVLMIGVNGVGKTTTIGKLASKYSAQGKKVLLAAGDTYRAAAVLQLEMWGKRVGCPVVKGKDNADPGAVIFEAIKRARDEGYDMVIADTAGRLHTKVPLMDELKKVERTIAKATDGRVADEVFLVLDATTGQNAVQQMKLFREAMGVTGVVLTKLDGTAKGGVVLGIVDQHKVPVRFIGLGERVEDLREFDARNFVDALFAKPAEATLAA